VASAQAAASSSVRRDIALVLMILFSLHYPAGPTGQ
jgi:hypothetical protein